MISCREFFPFHVRVDIVVNILVENWSGAARIGDLTAHRMYLYESIYDHGLELREGRSIELIASVAPWTSEYDTRNNSSNAYAQIGDEVFGLVVLGISVIVEVVITDVER